MTQDSIPTLRIAAQKNGRTGKIFYKQLESIGFVSRPGTLAEAYPLRRFPAEIANTPVPNIDITVFTLAEAIGKPAFKVIVEERKNSDLIRELPYVNGFVCGEDYLTEEMLMPSIEGVVQKPNIAMVGWLGIGRCSVNLLVPQESIPSEREGTYRDQITESFATASRIATKYPATVKAIIAQLGFGPRMPFQGTIDYYSGGVERQVRIPSERAVEIVETGNTAFATYLNPTLCLGLSQMVLVANLDNLKPDDVASLFRLRDTLQPNTELASKPHRSSILQYWKSLDQLPRLAV